MDFPAYVPVAVRVHVTHYIEGNEEAGWGGWDNTLATPSSELSEIEQKIERHSGQHLNQDNEYLADLNKRRTEIIEHRKWLGINVFCMRRLVHDERMQPAYALLTGEFNSDKQWDRFIHAAWAAQSDYSSDREGLKQAKEIKDEIAVTASKLIKLLKKFPETGIQGPSEFFSIPELLEKTTHAGDYSDNYIWQSVLPFILGELPKSEPTAYPNDLTISLNIHEPNRAREIDCAATLQYAWEKAPPVTAFLQPLVDAAEKFVPTPDSGRVIAAISSKKRNAKIEYIRAFATLLKERDFEMTAAIMNAIATVATVVINSPDIDVSYDDVRKAIDFLG